MKTFLPFHKSGVQFNAMLQTAQGLELQSECATEKAYYPDRGKASSSVHSSFGTLFVWRVPNAMSST